MKNSLFKNFSKYVTLSILGMLGLSCYILADTFFVARGIGADGLTALNLAIPIYSFIHGAGLMLGIGGATRFSLSKSKQVFTQSAYLACFIAVILVLVGVFFSNPLASLLGGDIKTHTMNATYLRVILCFSPFFIANNVVICFVRNDGNPKLSMAAMLIGSFSNIVLDYIFIFPCKLGMFGAAVATGIAPIISLLILSAHFARKANTFTQIKTKPNLHKMRDLSTLGISALITEVSSGIVIIVFNIIILNIEGNVGVAAYGIIANVALVVTAIFTGVSQGIQPLISTSHRKNAQQDVKKLYKYSLITSLLLSGAVYLLTIVFAPQIVSIFNKSGDTALSAIALKGLPIYFIAFFFLSINILNATLFVSIDNPKSAFFISTMRGFAIIIPVAIIMSFLFGMTGVWLALAVTEILVLALTATKTAKAVMLKTE